MLWRKVMQGLSAGRVQSVATRLVVERERERWEFIAAGYWDIVATLDPGAFTARLSAVDGARVAQGRDFGRDGALRTKDVVQLAEDDARGLAAALDGAEFTRSPPSRRSRTRAARRAPFMTSTLQQEASRKLRLSSQQTMRVAQRLYENGLITYMRTDSTTLSESALTAARDQARDLYGADVGAGAAAPVRAQGEERAGGARGDPAGRRPLPHARRRRAASSRATSSSSTT